ncbi:MAG: hypothetical protein QOJ39_2261 [Candidatus Eremiobacteraeota bacterium]|nr:hypothetical protein [Candidatus Eremiobacteraeota bacterium]
MVRMRVLREVQTPPLRPAAYDRAVAVLAEAVQRERGERPAISPVEGATGIPHLFPLRAEHAGAAETRVVNRRVDGVYVVARPRPDRLAAPDGAAVLERVGELLDTEVVPLIAPGARATDAGPRWIVDHFYAFEVGGVAFLTYATFEHDLRRTGMTFGPGFGAHERRLASAPLVLDAAPALGRHVLFAAGDTIVTNHHFVSRDMRYAIDLVPLDDASSTVIAPVEGTVTEAVDGNADDVARGDPARAASPLGNYVRVRSGAHELCFAHLARGSVAVAAGRSVGAGEILGKIGDSGRSAEPHLHVHVTTVDGVPHGVPIRFRVSGELWEPLRGAVVEQTRI